MKIIRLLYLKYTLSLLLCLISSFVIFLIFSLIGNLDEEYSFKIILITSLLNSMQILIYVPSFIFLLSIILFMIFLRSKNEIIIIKSYMNTKKIMIFFLPVIIFFTSLEINKKEIASLIEDSKSSLTKGISKIETQIYIENYENMKIFNVLKNFDENNFEEVEYRSYEISDKKILLAYFSNDLIHTNNTLIAKNYTEYHDNLIKEVKEEKLINIDLNKINFQKRVNINNVKNNNILNLSFLNLTIFFILFYNFIFLNFFSKKFTSIKQTIRVPVLTGLIILVYSFFIFNNSLTLFKLEFELLSSVIISIFLLKEFLNE